MTQLHSTARDRIQKVLDEMFLEESKERLFLVKSDVLLSDTGFDSLAFAVFFARLDDEFGVDPFQDVPVENLPRTFGDLLDSYEFISSRPGSLNSQVGDSLLSHSL